MNVFKGHAGRYIFFVALGILSAAGNTSIIYVINKVINNYIAGDPVTVRTYLFYFSGALVLFFASRWLMSVRMVGFMQKLLYQTRLKIVQMILNASHHALADSKERIYTGMTRDTNNIVNACVNLVDLMTNTIVILFCCVYMGFLSWKLLLCTLGLLFFTLLIYMYVEKRATVMFNKAMTYDDTFVRQLNELLSGFKEIIIARRKGVDILNKHMQPAIEAGVTLNRKALVSYLNNRVIGQLAFYVFIGLLLLFLGQSLGIEKGVLVSFIFVLLYIWGPIETVVLLVPSLSQANVSLKRLSALEQSLQENEVTEAPEQELPAFEALTCRNISYQYRNEENETTFRIGPADFTLRRGEVAFIYGVNGSGKTTFVNLLIGLFMYERGEVYLNDVRIDSPVAPSYRSLFAPVFSDFHLFDECYGVDKVDEAKANEYLKVFELDKKVAFDGGRFTTKNLSTGQRKRLALICAMLEQKPILILDEFAADQDPYFRKKFYEELLNYIRKEGFTILAITHDDHYYHHADKLYSMDYGKLRLMEAYNPKAVPADVTTE